MLAALLAVLITSSDAPPYTGPLGLHWGDSKAAVKKALQGKLKLGLSQKRTSGLSGLVYTGEFAGTAPQAIVLYFEDDRFVAAFVQYPANADQPASKRYEDIVSKMQGKYGAPDKASEAPEALSIAAAGNEEAADTFAAAQAQVRYQILDSQIVSGTYRPQSIWVFGNRACVGVLVEAKSDARGHTLLSPAWVFVESPELAQTIASAGDAGF